MSSTEGPSRGASHAHGHSRIPLPTLQLPVWYGDLGLGFEHATAGRRRFDGIGCANRQALLTQSSPLSESDVDHFPDESLVRAILTRCDVIRVPRDFPRKRSVRLPQAKLKLPKKKYAQKWSKAVAARNFSEERRDVPRSFVTAREVGVFCDLS